MVTLWWFLAFVIWISTCAKAFLSFQTCPWLSGLAPPLVAPPSPPSQLHFMYVTLIHPRPCCLIFKNSMWISRWKQGPDVRPLIPDQSSRVMVSKCEQKLNNLWTLKVYLPAHWCSKKNMLPLRFSAVATWKCPKILPSASWPCPSTPRCEIISSTSLKMCFQDLCLRNGINSERLNY